MASSEYEGLEALNRYKLGQFAYDVAKCKWLRHVYIYIAMFPLIPAAFNKG